MKEACIKIKFYLIKHELPQAVTLIAKFQLNSAEIRQHVPQVQLDKLVKFDPRLLSGFNAPHDDAEVLQSEGEDENSEDSD